MSARKADPRLIGAGALAIRALLGALGRTYRLRYVHGDRYRSVIEAGEPVVLSLWHQQMFCAYRPTVGDLVGGGMAFTVLTSQSRDGDFLARVVAPLGVDAVRGSTSKAAASSLRKLARAVQKGSSVALIPDGPRGPSFRCQPGPILLAQIAQCPILPLAVAAGRYWQLGSWDRMVIPKPGSRVVLAAGELVRLPRQMSATDREAARSRLESTLNDLTAEALEAAGAEVAPAA